MTEIVKICRVHGELKPEQIRTFTQTGREKPTVRCKICESNVNKKYYVKNFERLSEKQRIKYKENPEKRKQSSSRSMKKNRHKHTKTLSENSKRYQLRHKDRLAEKRKKNSGSLSDAYVKGLIKNHVGLKAAYVPPELIEIVRATVLIKRKAKEAKQ